MVFVREYRLIITTNDDGSETLQTIPVNTSNFFNTFSSRYINTEQLLIDLTNPETDDDGVGDLLFEDVVVSMDPYDFDNIGEWETLADETCTICSDTVHGCSVVKDLLCEHIFHIGCLRRHCTMYSVKCPNCRMDLRDNIL